MADNYKGIALQMPYMDIAPVITVFRRLLARLMGSVEGLGISSPKINMSSIGTKGIRAGSSHESRLMAIKEQTSKERDRAEELALELAAKRELFEVRSAAARVAKEIRETEMRSRGRDKDKVKPIDRSWKA